MPVNWFNHTSYVAIVTPTDRPQSVDNRCAIVVLMASLSCHVEFGFFYGYRGFGHRTKSYQFLFLLHSE